MDLLKKILFLNFFSHSMTENIKDFGWTALRVLIPAMMLGHGLPKLMNFSEMASQFPDPVGLGSTVTLALTVLAEVLGSIGLILGLFTRWSAFGGFLLMMGAAWILHGSDPFKAKELALVYGCCYLFFICAGGGKYSLDRILNK